jgi:hypothetical protein
LGEASVPVPELSCGFHEPCRWVTSTATDEVTSDTSVIIVIVDASNTPENVVCPDEIYFPVLIQRSIHGTITKEAI